MKLSKETVSILKSFAGINTGMVVQEGNVLQVESEPRDMFAKATISEDFPQQFAIYDVPSFNNTLMLFEDANLDFETEYVAIKSGRNRCSYYYTDPSFIAHGDWLNIPDSAYVLNFELSNDDINNIQKASGIMSLDQLEFVSDSGTIVCNVVSKSGDSKHIYSISLSECNEDLEFKLIMRIAENFRFFPGDYEISVADVQGTFVFCANNKDTDLKYQVAMDRKSKFGN